MCPHSKNLSMTSNTAFAFSSGVFPFMPTPLEVICKQSRTFCPDVPRNVRDEDDVDASSDDGVI